ncbi:MAG TPA: DUF697 domain-containing protein [Tissierellia bacterium]|jgi:membrane protein implicated in regulation of membrane protease activity|nr:DUF697 domain-containing protein [Tissierellia bacterium]
MLLNRTIKRILLWISLGLILFFLLIAFNQLMALYNNLSTVSAPLAVILTTLAGLSLLALLLTPLYVFYRFPKLEDLPHSIEDPEYQAYLDRRLEKLKRNRYLTSQGFDFSGDSSEEIIERAYKVLKLRGDEVMRADASAVFLTTAVSQNGVLDGLTVMAALIKLVYTLTTLYENRPNLRRITYLYGQIAGVVLIARTIEDADLIEEQIEPLMASLLGGTIISVIPGAVGVTTLIVNSVVEGAVNSLLALRVGAIAQRYLSETMQFDKRQIRRSASLEATKQLGSILSENAVLVVKSFANATKDATKNALRVPWKRA